MCMFVTVTYQGLIKWSNWLEMIKLRMIDWFSKWVKIVLYHCAGTVIILCTHFLKCYHITMIRFWLHHNSLPSVAKWTKKLSVCSFVCSFICSFCSPGCEKAFITFSALFSHNRTHFRETSQFTCTYPGCDKRYDKACRLKIHLRSHTGTHSCGYIHNKQVNPLEQQTDLSPFLSSSFTVFQGRGHLSVIQNLVAGPSLACQSCCATKGKNPIEGSGRKVQCWSVCFRIVISCILSPSFMLSFCLCSISPFQKAWWWSAVHLSRRRVWEVLYPCRAPERPQYHPPGH